ncbi:MAG: hypothetical protein ACRD96_14330, partial [Bryobacteraceae bacterium]
SLSLRMRAHNRPTRRGVPSRSTYTKTSLSITSPARDPNAFRQALFFQLQPDGVVPGIGYVRKSLRHPQGEEDGGVCANRSAGVAFLDPAQGHPA